ncbi:MAG: MFS transporter [Anaerolineales bacterium]|nr:MFS transporter [Anaerolineales bacterium]
MASRTPSKQKKSRWTAVAPALESRNFRLFWIAQIISVTGTSLQVIAESYLIYEITDSAFWLGAVGFIALIPVVPISLVGGVLIDRVPRRKLIIVTQTGLFLQAIIFALLTISGNIQLWQMILLYFVFGALLAIDHPARRAFLVDIVDRENLSNAVALNATIFNISNLIGFAIGGLLIAAVGVGITMVINALTYIFPIIALATIKVVDVAQDSKKGGFGVALSEGFVAVWRQPAILGTMALMAVVGGLAYPATGLMAAYAAEVMAVGAVGLGILLSSAALGAVIGTVIVARLGAHQKGRNLIIAALILPLLIIAVAFAPNMVTACLALIALGGMLLILQSLAVTIVQLHIEDRVRGRVMTIYSMLHAGADTGSNMVVGALAVPLGLSTALVVAGVVAWVFAVGLNLFMPAIRKMD